MTRVLLVDDEPDILESLAMVLEFEGLAVVTATTGPEALERLGDDIALVLTDYRMPGMDGLELVGHIREHWPDLPVMLMSAYHDADLRKRALALGVHAFVSKPVDVGDLAKAIADAIKQ